MARKKPPEKPIAKDDPSRIIVTSMEDVMHNSMIPYAEHVILERALPRVEDGLKPVQRRILYTMLELGTTPDKPHRKCARIVGDCLGKYHPHGDSSVYDALVRMAQDFSMRGPMVDGHGNFGSIDGDGAAAMRYTEARMAPLAMLMLRDIEKDTVPFRLNFDDTLKEPDMLPARFPNLLVNGANGIAVGLATNIPPHNLGEAIRAAVVQIENPDISLDDLMQIIPGPDFPTGGVLIKNDEIRQGYLTGRSKLQVRARIHTEDGSAGRKMIVITEIPYGVNKAAMLEKIQRLTDEKKAALSGIYDIRDESDREGLRAVIELKRDTDPDKVLAYLYKYSDLQVTFGVNMVAIADGKPVQMGLKAMLGYFIDHQKRVVTRRTEYDLKQAEARAHILEGLMIAVDNLDEVIRLIRASKNPKEARIALMEAFALDEVQAQAILDMRLQRLTNLEILALRKEFEDLQKLIKSLRAILGSEKKLMAVIAKELREVEEQYADPRRTTIETVEEVKADQIDNTPVPDEAVVAFTGAGQFKRMWPAIYRKTPLPSPAEDPREAPRFLFMTKTDETLLIFTDLGNCYPLPVSALNECKPKDRGQLPVGLLPKLEDGEQVIWIDCCMIKEIASRPELLLVTASGMAKRLVAADLDVRSKKFTVMGLKGEDRLACILPLASDGKPQDVLLVSRLAMSIRFAADSVPQQGRTSAGVKAISLAEDDSLLLATQIRKGDELLLISDRGSGKRVPAMAFERQNRAGKGVRAFPFVRNGSNGTRLACAIRTDAGEADILITQAQSQPTRMPKSSVQIQPMSGKGSPLVMAILNDVVTEVFLLPPQSAT
ncbi:MAG: DNA topoisomerase 4 subunit A [Clostridia bacterium]|nr:DNA topoisomerase 4 subunit A [Clostridia bacterium]